MKKKVKSKKVEALGLIRNIRLVGNRIFMRWRNTATLSS